MSFWSTSGWNPFLRLHPRFSVSVVDAVASLRLAPLVLCCYSLLSCGLDSRSAWASGRKASLASVQLVLSGPIAGSARRSVPLQPGRECCCCCCRCWLGFCLSRCCLRCRCNLRDPCCCRCCLIHCGSCFCRGDGLDLLLDACLSQRFAGPCSLDGGGSEGFRLSDRSDGPGALSMLPLRASFQFRFHTGLLPFVWGGLGSFPVPLSLQREDIARRMP